MSQNEIGLWLRNARLSSGMSQKAAAEAIGVSRNTLVRYERGKRSPTISRLQQLASLYKVELSWQERK